jgi:putative DNA primase/helicase
MASQPRERLDPPAIAVDGVAAEKPKEARQAGASTFLGEVEPWPEPVEGAELLRILFDTFKRHVVLSDYDAIACALWVLHAHALDAAEHSPILDINSPVPRCGKTNLLTLLHGLVPKPMSASNVTPAVVFRAIEARHPTLLIDEGDTFLSDKSELRGILNSGQKRSQAYVYRCVGNAHMPMDFSTWCPKALAHIGRVHPTILDRAIRIELRRKLKTEKVERIPKGAHAFSDLERQCARWAADNLESLKTATPSLPPVNDRAADNWEPLLAIAEACSPEWAAFAQEAAVRLSGVDDDDDEIDGIALLRDIETKIGRELKKNPSSVSLPSVVFAEELAQMEDRKWPEFKNGRPITPMHIAALLKPFKIYPRAVTAGRKQVQGYRFEQFASVFQRYLSQQGA